jgi:hypothetical protein
MLEGGGPDHLTTTSPERKGREGGMEERFLRVCHRDGRKHEELDKQGVGAGPNSGLDYGNETTFVQYVTTVKTQERNQIDRFMQCRPGLILTLQRKWGRVVRLLHGQWAERSSSPGQSYRILLPPGKAAQRTTSSLLSKKGRRSATTGTFPGGKYAFCSWKLGHMLKVTGRV